jgi:hypothetical protein
MNLILKLIVFICFLNASYALSWEIQQNLTCKNAVAVKTKKYDLCMPAGYYMAWVNKDRIVLKNSINDIMVSFYFSGYDITNAEDDFVALSRRFTYRNMSVYVHQTTADPSFIVYSWSVELVSNELYMVVLSPAEQDISELFDAIFDSQKVF